MYIVAGEDVVTRADDGTATAGRNYILHGKFLKVAGDHPSVGVCLTSASGQKFLLTPDMIAENSPAKLIILLPTGLADGNYTLTVTTQYSGSGALLKVPRTADKVITLGQSPGGIGTLPTEPPSGGGGGGYIDPNT
jgi:polysaccharide pyruvyl transferase WcaK-like protein